MSSPPPAVLRARRVAPVLLAALCALVAAGWAAAEVARALAPALPLTAVDADVTRHLARARTRLLTDAFVAFSALASLPFVAALVGVLGLAAGHRTRYWHWLWLPVVAGAGALAISATVKVLTARARPPLDIAVVDAYGSAFPSGHAVRALAVYGALAWLASAFLRGRGVRALLWFATAALVLAIGASRVYLGAHWPTDVLAGFVLGAVWLAVVLAVTGTLRPRPPAPGCDGGRRSSQG